MALLSDLLWRRLLHVLLDQAANIFSQKASSGTAFDEDMLNNRLVHLWQNLRRWKSLAGSEHWDGYGVLPICPFSAAWATWRTRFTTFVTLKIKSSQIQPNRI
jgi:hypothetical protein